VGELQNSYFDEKEKPGIANIMTIMSAVTGMDFKQIEEKYRDGGYGKFKTEAGEAVVEYLRPIQERYQEIIGDRAGLETLLRRGAQKARDRAEPLLNKVHKVIGFIPEQLSNPL